VADERAPEGGHDDATGSRSGLFRLAVVLAVVFVALVGVRILADAGAETASGDGGAVPRDPSTTPAAGASEPVTDPAAFLIPDPTPAPAIDLTGPDGAPLSLAAMRGDPVLVFFGYTHCPDVCPVTIGAVGEAIDAVPGARGVMVSVDPERDTVPWLAEFAKYLPDGFTAATGSPAAIRSTADAWGVRYAKVEGDDPDAYAMAHTADVFVVDGGGSLRARIPFGTPSDAIAATVREVAATTAEAPTLSPASPAPAPTQSAPAAESVTADIVSSSVWAGGDSPVILRLRDPATGAPIDDPALGVRVTLLDPTGQPVGEPVAAPVVQPRGISEVSFVPTLDIPAAGTWGLRLDVAGPGGVDRTGRLSLTALEPGGSAPLGVAAPTIRTPTAADVGGDLTAVTTDPLPDPRLSSTSTADALAAGRPFVLVVDSVRFRVTPVCGRAVVLAKGLVDRWTDVPFIHHEPYRYSVVTTEPVIEGSLEAPRLTEPADAWGVGAEPWGIDSMPWVFVVDGDGIVRAKYQGVMGSADIDVILSLLEAGG
jgi:cytochrome oxidase Cu insertion factor (SCO1/SenC/PrrC family)